MPTRNAILCRSGFPLGAHVAVVVARGLAVELAEAVADVAARRVVGAELLDLLGEELSKSVAPPVHGARPAKLAQEPPRPPVSGDTISVIKQWPHECRIRECPSHVLALRWLTLC